MKALLFYRIYCALRNGYRIVVGTNADTCAAKTAVRAPQCFSNRFNARHKSTVNRRYSARGFSRKVHNNSLNMADRLSPLWNSFLKVSMQHPTHMFKWTE